METLRSALPRIVHLAHTTEAGGAEMALRRLLDAETGWEPGILIPAASADDDVFEGMQAPRWTRGVRQPVGASARPGIGLVVFGARLFAQAALTRWHHAVRDSDLVVANSTRSAAYGALALVGTRRPFAVHLRDQITPDSLGRFGYRMMTKVILPRADGVVANSQSTLDTAEPFLRRDALAKVIASPAGLDRLGQDRPHDGPLRIGMLARLDPWKGQLALLEAFAQAFADDRGVELEFAGAALFEHEAYADELRERAAELGVADRVHLRGHISEIAPLLARWNIAVQYSLRPEPLGQNVLQCLAAGTAVVVADEGGPTEWVRHEQNGLRVTPREPALLAEALRRLVDDEALRAALSAEAIRTPGLLSDADIATIHSDFYRDVIEAGVEHNLAATHVTAHAPRQPLGQAPLLAAFRALKPSRRSLRTS